MARSDSRCLTSKRRFAHIHAGRPVDWTLYLPESAKEAREHLGTEPNQPIVYKLPTGTTPYVHGQVASHFPSSIQRLLAKTPNVFAVPQVRTDVADRYFFDQGETVFGLLGDAANALPPQSAAGLINGINHATDVLSVVGGFDVRASLEARWARAARQAQRDGAQILFDSGTQHPDFHDPRALPPLAGFGLFNEDFGSFLGEEEARFTRFDETPAISRLCLTALSDRRIDARDFEKSEAVAALDSQRVSDLALESFLLLLGSSAQSLSEQAVPPSLRRSRIRRITEAALSQVFPVGESPAIGSGSTVRKPRSADAEAQPDSGSTEIGL